MSEELVQTMIERQRAELKAHTDMLQAALEREHDDFLARLKKAEAGAVESAIEALVGHIERGEDSRLSVHNRTVNNLPVDLTEGVDKAAAKARKGQIPIYVMSKIGGFVNGQKSGSARDGGQIQRVLAVIDVTEMLS